MPATVIDNVAPETINSGTLRRIPPLLSVPGKVRLIKDCLRVGRWYLGDDAHGQPVYWEVTPELLEELERNFASQWSAGHFHNLQWGHPAPIPGNSEQQVVEYLRHLWHEDGVLYFGVYVTPETAALLQEKHRQVSVRVNDSFHVQEGQSWGPSLIHVAIVDHGAVPMQMPFKELSAKSGKTRDVRLEKQLAFSDGNLKPSGDNASEQSSKPKASKPKAKSMDFPSLVELINKLLTKVSPNAHLPTEGENAVTEENVVQLLQIILEVLGEDTSDVEVEPLEAPAVPSAELSAFAKSVTEGFANLSKQLSALGKQVSEDKLAGLEKSYRERVDALGRGGLPAANCSNLIKLGQKNGWDHATLDAFSGVPGLKLGSQTRHLNNASAPSVGITDEEKAKAKKLLGL